MIKFNITTILAILVVVLFGYITFVPMHQPTVDDHKKDLDSLKTLIIQLEYKKAQADGTIVHYKDSVKVLNQEIAAKKQTIVDIRRQSYI